MKIKNLLCDNEEILLITKEERTKPGGTLVHPRTIYVTNRRIISIRMWIKQEIIDLLFDNIAYIELKRGLFTHSIYFKIREDIGELIKCNKLEAIPKEDAENIFRMIREKIPI